LLVAERGVDFTRREDRSVTVASGREDDEVQKVVLDRGIREHTRVLDQVPPNIAKWLERDKPRLVLRSFARFRQ
jgi:hypothetical protein